MKKIISSFALLFAVFAQGQSGTQASAGLTPFNTVILSGNGTTTSTSYAALTTNPLNMPIVPANSNRHGSCDIVWQVASTSTTPTFAFNLSAAATGLYLQGSFTQTTTSVDNITLPIAAITAAATPTAFTTSLPAANANTNYHTHVDFDLVNGSNAQTVSIYAKVNSGTLTVEGSFTSCAWGS